MKKFLSVLLSAAVLLPGMTAFSASVQNDTADAAQGTDIVVFGDSIASGYGLHGNVEHNYGEICADYLGGSVSNYAVPGHKTDDLIKVIEGLDSAEKSKVADAEYIIISVGGNDMMGYASKRFLDFSVRKGFLNPGVSADDIPDDPSINDLMELINIRGEGGIMEYANKGFNQQNELASEMSAVTSNLVYSNTTYEGYIPNHIIPNIETAVSEIRELAPDAEIIVQTIYQPLQLERDYIDSVYGLTSNYSTLLSLLRSNMETIVKAYNKELNNVEGIEIVDVYTEFTALSPSESQTMSNPGHAVYFADVQTGDLQSADIHPNQKGHLAIAAAILKKIGNLHNDNGLLSAIYNSLGDKDSYPEIPLATLMEVMGEGSEGMLGDIDGNGAITAVDATMTLTAYAKGITGQDTGLTDAQLALGDVDGNGATDANDASAILSYYAFSSVSGGVTFEEYLKDKGII